MFAMRENLYLEDTKHEFGTQTKYNIIVQYVSNSTTRRTMCAAKTIQAVIAPPQWAFT